MNPIIVIGSGMIVLILFGMVAAIVLGKQNEQQRRTMAVIKGQFNNEAANVRGGKSDQDRRRAEIAKKLKEQGGENKKKGNLKLMIEQAGLEISVTRYWVFCGLSAALFTLIGLATHQPIWAIPGITLVGLFLPPRIVMGFRIKRRRKKFIEEFADTLEAMVRLLKAGMPITEAISMASREFGGPVGEEMSRVYDAQRIGISLPEAALTMARRMPLTEVQMFATGLAIQAQTGASLSEVLLNLAGVIRARYRLKRKVQALSSEAKASAMIIGSLPFLVGGGLFFINPDYMNIMFETLPGRIALGFGVFWMGTGILVMKIMINFKI